VQYVTKKIKNIKAATITKSIACRDNKIQLKKSHYYYSAFRIGARSAQMHVNAKYHSTLGPMAC
jgi:hypothetical protein